MYLAMSLMKWQKPKTHSKLIKINDFAEPQRPDKKNVFEAVKQTFILLCDGKGVLAD